MCMSNLNMISLQAGVNLGSTLIQITVSNVPLGISAPTCLFNPVDPPDRLRLDVEQLTLLASVLILNTF
jgi:hypothetical protein